MSVNKEDYRPLPFWSWNDKLDIERLKKQIHWMYKKNMGGYFMHARSGLQTEYLSNEWMQCIKTCADEGCHLGMKAWIYDENGWPSGFVGGKLLDNEDNRDKYILTHVGDYDENASVSYLLDGDALQRMSEGDTNGEYLNLYIHTSVSTVDILNPDVVKQFITQTHDKYLEYMGETFTEKIEGFFTDEPQYYRWKTPYSAMVERYWKEQFGEDILDELGLLFVEKKGYRRFRYRYWKTMQELMLNSFAKLVYEWCDSHGVKLTGHYIEEVTMGLQMMCCGGVMPFYEYMHIPGIDWLGKETTSEISAKQVGSVAAQLGKKQVLTETFACCGWDVTPIDLRRIAGFQYVNGVNMICQHLVPYSERGTRKYDHPAHYEDINPWVKEDFGTFNDYFAKLGYFLGEGEQHVNVALFHPIRSTYFDYKREQLEEGFGVAKLDEELRNACRTLSSRGIDYHFLDETLLCKYGSVEDNTILCGKCRYTYIVFPSILTMDRATELLLRKYIGQGGKVLLLGNAPSFLESEPYDYCYLDSNVSLEEIEASQPYRVTNKHTEIYSTYRTMGEKSYLYVINASDSETQVQTYDCGADVRSFSKVNFTDMSECNVPLEICLKPGEDAFLYLSEQEAIEPPKKKVYEMQFQDATVSVQENYLPVDRISYSIDSVEYSKPWPCSALFQKLLREQYQGVIYFRYEFEMDVIPEKIYIKTEKSREVCVWINGSILSEPMIEDGYLITYDISDFVRVGVNEYIVQVDWYENKNVYFSLFGENVTESLKNCIVYDTELQPIEIVGTFGVYPRGGYFADEDVRFVRGNDFYLGAMPERVTEPSIEGFPFYAGEMVMKQDLIFDTTNILLQINGDYHIAIVNINGQEAGKILWEKEIDVSEYAVVGKNEIEVRFILGNRNRMGPHHLIANKDGGINPRSFEFFGEWEEDYCKKYHADYDIKKIFTVKRGGKQK